VAKFEKADPKASASSSSGEVVLEAGATSHESLDDIVQLKGRKYDLCRTAIAQGCDPDDPGSWTDGGEDSIPVGLTCGAAWHGDRSDVTWYVVWALAHPPQSTPPQQALVLGHVPPHAAARRGYSGPLPSPTSSRSPSLHVPASQALSPFDR
jgi:hypothetical protein